MSIVQPLLLDKCCFVQCPPERCNCRRGNPAQWEFQQAQLGIKEPADSLLVPVPAPDQAI